MHRSGLFLGISAFLWACAGAPSNGPTEDQENPAMNTSLPICADAKTLGGLDGQRIRLVGIYGRSLTQRKMRGPGTFEGEMHIRLTGSPADYDPKGNAEAKAIVELGERPADEIARLDGQRVSVEGLLILDPYRAVREAEVNYATVIYGPPRLRETGPVRAEGP